jgi:hypothetical protein
MDYKIGDSVIVTGCGMSGGRHNPNFAEQKAMVGRRYNIEDIKYGYYVINGWHFSSSEITLSPLKLCKTCGHALVDQY